MSERTVLSGPGPPGSARGSRERDLTLLDLLDRLLEGGVAIHGEVTLAVADIDLVRVGLRLVAGSVETLDPSPGARQIEKGVEEPWSTSTP